MSLGRPLIVSLFVFSQKWKAFTAEIETMTKSLKKKDTKGALVAYDGAIAALDEYLAKVELPSAKEIK